MIVIEVLARPPAICTAKGEISRGRGVREGEGDDKNEQGCRYGRGLRPRHASLFPRLGNVLGAAGLAAPSSRAFGVGHQPGRPASRITGAFDLTGPF